LTVTILNASTGLDGFCRRVRHFFYIIKASITTKLNGGKTHCQTTVKLAAKTDVITFVAIRTTYIQRRLLAPLASEITSIHENLDRWRWRFLKWYYSNSDFALRYLRLYERKWNVMGTWKKNKNTFLTNQIQAINYVYVELHRINRYWDRINR